MSFYTNKYILHDDSYILKNVFFDKYFTKKMKILDIGCSVGNFIAFNPENIIGIDKDKEACNIATKRGFRIFNCDIEKENLSFRNKFDAIHLGGVLEHCKNPDLVIQKLLPLLKENGIFVINVPNARVIPFYKFYWDYTHQTPYTKESLIALAQNNGLEIVKIEPETKYSILGLNRLNKIFPYLTKLILKSIGRGEGIIGCFRKKT